MEGESEKDTEKETISEGSSNMKETSLIPDIGNEKDEESEVNNDKEKKETSEDPSMKDTSLVPDIGNEKDEQDEVKKETSGDPSMKDTSLVLDIGDVKDTEKETLEDLTMKDTSLVPHIGNVKKDTENKETSEDPTMKDTSLVPDVGNEKNNENEVKNDTEKKESSEDSTNMKDTSLLLDKGREKDEENEVDSDTNLKDSSLNPEEDAATAEVGASHHHETSENSESVNVPDAAPTSERGGEESSRDDAPGVDDIATSQQLDEEDGEHPESTSPAQEEAEEDQSSSAEDITYEENVKLHQELCKEKDKVSQHNSQLQAKLADYLRRKARDDEAQTERETPASEYERHAKVLSEVKQQLEADAEEIRQKTEELRSLSKEKLDEAESEWQAFMTLKQQVTVATLSRRLGKQEAQAKVEATLAAERLRQDELIALRLRHIKLKTRIRRLEAELRDAEEHGRDPLQLQYEQLQAARLEQRKQAEKQSEESTKLQAKISSSLEVLTNVKEKLFWTQRDVQVKREQLAEVEATVARKREVLTEMKQARGRLQRDNQTLKERRGLLGNKVLLRDFEDAADAADVLRERLEKLKSRQTEIVLGCARWKRLETNQGQ